MASRSITYLFELVDRFSPNAAKMQQTAAAATQTINQLGQAFVAMEQKARKGALATEDGANRALEGARARYEQMRGLQQGTMNAMNGAVGALATFGMGRGAVREADQLLQIGADLQTMKAKLGQAGVTAQEIHRATDRSFQLSGKYRNLSATEIMELINDARTNLIGSFDEILDNIEPLSRLGGFLKAYDGGKHAGKHKDLLGELNRAMQSGELLGKVSPAELAKHVEMMGVMKVAFGDKFNAGQYLTAIRNSNTSLLSTDDTFKYAYFPALLQSMGPRYAVSLATLANKVQAGIMIRNTSADYANQLGLLDPSSVRRKAGGKIDTFGLKYANQDEFSRNPTEWAINTLLPKIAPLVRGMEAGAIQEAWKAGDQHQLEHLVKKIDMGDLRTVLGKLFYDRNAVSGLVETFAQLAKISKDVEQVRKVDRDFGKFRSYDKAKQSFRAAFDDLIATASGPWVEFVEKRMNQLAGVMTRVTSFARRNPEFTAWVVGLGVLAAAAVGTALTLGVLAVSFNVLAAALGATAAVRYGAILGGGLAGGGAAALGRILSLTSLLRASIAGAFIYTIIANPEPIIQAMQLLDKLRIDAANWWQNNQTHQQRMADFAAKQKEQQDYVAQNPEQAWTLGNFGTRWWNWMSGNEGINPDRFRPWAMQGGIYDIPKSAATIPAGEAQREIAVRTQVDITPQIPLNGTVTVTVQGTVNGPVNGSGQAAITGGLQVKSDAPRGETAPP